VEEIMKITGLWNCVHIIAIIFSMEA